MTFLDSNILVYLIDPRNPDKQSVAESIAKAKRSSGMTIRALEIKKQYGLQFYDSLLLATAEANGCDEFITEDLNDGQLYCGIKAVNPFIGRAAQRTPRLISKKVKKKGK